eukprot:PhM_4_TR16131/c1_g2_i3/m.88165
MAQHYHDARELHCKSTEELRAAFTDAARARSLPAWKAIIGTYTLFGDDEDRRVFTSVLLAAGTMEEMIYLHNMHVVTRMAHSDAFLSQHHVTLRRKAVPLLPPTQEFSSLNLSIVQEVAQSMSAPVSGAGTEPRRSVSAYSHVTQQGFDVATS